MKNNIYLYPVLLMFLTFQQALAIEPNCIIHSPNVPELALGANQQKICSDVIAALNNADFQLSNEVIIVTVSDVQAFSVGAMIQMNQGDKMINLIGREYWYPGDSYFVIEKQ